MQDVFQRGIESRNKNNSFNTPKDKDVPKKGPNYLTAPVDVNYNLWNQVTWDVILNIWGTSLDQYLVDYPPTKSKKRPKR